MDEILVDKSFGGWQKTVFNIFNTWYNGNDEYLEMKKGTKEKYGEIESFV